MIKTLRNLTWTLVCAWFAVLATGLTSCERRPLEEADLITGDYAKILLLTDWRDLSEIPTGMTAMFFPENGGQPTVIMSNNITRNEVRLKRGRYKLLLFNQSIYEFGSMNFTGMDSLNTACANLTQLSGNSTTTAADYSWYRQTVSTSDSVSYAVRTPEPFNADRIYYEVTPEMCAKQADKDANPNPWGQEFEEYIDTIFSIPQPVPPTMNIKVRVRGINNAYQVKGYITNMAKSDLFGLNRTTEQSAVHVLGTWQISPFSNDKTNGYITTSFRCFGVPGLQVTDAPYYTSRFWEEAYKAAKEKSNAKSINLDEAMNGAPTVAMNGAHAPRRIKTFVDYGENYLFLEIVLKDGKTHYTKRFKVTEDITYHEEQLLLELVLELDPADPKGEDPAVILPDVDDVIGSGGAGFDATVEDWKQENHTIQF